MQNELSNLTSVIEEEILLGQELLDNLGGQRKAILSWDVAALMQWIQDREPRVRRVAALEETRRQVLARLIGAADASPSLKELLAGLPQEPETARLSQLQNRIRDIYGRLRDEESRLLELMQNLLEPLREALRPLSLCPAPVYGENGTTSRVRPASGLIEGKA
jgi:hypothetical protein